MSTSDNSTDQALPEPPKGWKTGSDPATDAQKAYINTLAEQTSEETSEHHLTKAEASRLIDELRKEAGYEDKNVNDQDEP